jgi:hypothetical protein
MLNNIYALQKNYDKIFPIFKVKKNQTNDENLKKKLSADHLVFFCAVVVGFSLLN